MNTKNMVKFPQKTNSRKISSKNFSSEELKIAEEILQQVSSLASPQKEEAYVRLVFENCMQIKLKKAA